MTRPPLGGAFGLATLGCLILAGWALWTGGVLDGPIAREVRGSSVYVAPGVDLDSDAAQQVIGNRRLVVVLLAPGADRRGACKEIKGAAEGTVGLILSPDGDEFATYGCSHLPGGDKNFGKADVADMKISSGVDEFVDRPLEALKVAAVNYDLLVDAGTVPDGARTISPSLPRYLIAAAAVAAVLLGSSAVYLTGRRSARAALRRRELRDAATDDHSTLSAAAGVLAQQIIGLDARYATADPSFVRDYRRLTTDYVDLLTQLDAGTALTSQVESLTDRARALAG